MALFEESGKDIAYASPNTFMSLQINHQKPEFQSVKIRQALAYAINRQGIVDALLFGHGNVADTVYAESFWAHPGSDALPHFEYDPKKAIELFEEEGYTYSAYGNVMRDPDGEPVCYRLFAPSNDPIRVQTGTVIQANLEEIGIRVEFETMEFATLLGLLQKVEEKDRFDLAVMKFSMGAFWDAAFSTRSNTFDTVDSPNSFVTRITRRPL